MHEVLVLAREVELEVVLEAELDGIVETERHGLACALLDYDIACKLEGGNMGRGSRGQAGCAWSRTLRCTLRGTLAKGSRRRKAGERERSHG
ncbi:hypothetical protein GCM10011507_22090 [Edaphobacter acidisoli]|uniref:Uncharacterized protein n=1 Tax=Edaphobacter acidisoli TaxID=2040573 RepID=A0A916RUH6_9BACT|nr:hypothetical protein GCM10011507_22090 [Edaphobacter acidisoli]